MRRLISFFFILALFANCKNKSSDETKSSEKTNVAKESKSPKETVQAYLSATNHFDFETAKKFLITNKENQMILETLKKMEKSIPDKEKTRFIDKEKKASYFEKEITDSTAQIIVTPDMDAVIPIEFNLKKVSNDWLIESVISH